MRQEILTGGTVVCTGAIHTFGSDALLLARFCRPKPGQRVIDLCAGCGIVGLEWLDAGTAFDLTAVELDADAAALTRQSYSLYSGAADCRVEQEDARTLTLPEAGRFDLIACNPPYFTGGPQAADPARARARHDDAFPLEEMAAFACRHLRDGGKLTVCHKPEQAARLLTVLSQSGLEPKRMQPVYNRGKDTPWLVLVEAQKNRHPGLQWLPDQVLEAGAALYGADHQGASVTG